MVNPVTTSSTFSPSQMSSSLTSQIDLLSTTGRSGRISIAAQNDGYPRVSTVGASKNSFYDLTRNFADRLKQTESKVQDVKHNLDDSTMNSIEGPLLVIIRHGKTEHNKLGLFTGWEDAPLAMEGNLITLDTSYQYTLLIYVNTNKCHIFSIDARSQ